MAVVVMTVVVMMMMRNLVWAGGGRGGSQRRRAEGSRGNKCESQFAKHGRSPWMCAVARVDRFSSTHRTSVAPLSSGVRENSMWFGDNFLNDYSDVKNITQRCRAAITPRQHPDH
jgi:hypothetical protein